MFSWSHRKDPSRSGRGEMEQRRRQQGKGRGPRLERRNAVKNIDYEASGSGSASAFAGVSWSSSSSDESPGIGTSKSLDLSPSPYSNQTSFRLGGSIEGEVDLLYRSLGLTGPEDFAIPITVWEARGVIEKSGEQSAPAAGASEGSPRAFSSGKQLRRYDSLDLEAASVSTSHPHRSSEGRNQGWGMVMRLAFQSVGIVYGDIGTSPLYVYASTFPDGIGHEDDILGVLCLIIYTITLITLVKYVFLVLRANDNGDGETSQSLHEIFVSFGTVLSCKVATDFNGQSKGYGFVQFEHEDAAQKAIGQLNGMLINGKQVYVGFFVRRQEREPANGSPKFFNIYVKNLPEKFTDDDLKNEFGVFGEITSAVVMKDENGNSRGFGFVNFKDSSAAASAVEKYNGKSLNDKILYVGKAQKKAEREAELKAKYEHERNGRIEKLQGLNLYLKNLDDSINDDRLRELFRPFGSIISCKVMVDSQGQSKGSGFVQFSSPEEASRAISEMNGRMIGKKPLYVALAQRKEERRARLQV